MVSYGFPIVFLWFSHGFLCFPIDSPFSHGFIPWVHQSAGPIFLSLQVWTALISGERPGEPGGVEGLGCPNSWGLDSSTNLGVLHGSNKPIYFQVSYEWLPYYSLLMMSIWCHITVKQPYGGFRFVMTGYPQILILVGLSMTKTIHFWVSPFLETPISVGDEISPF